LGGFGRQDDAHDVAFLHDQKVFAIDAHLRAGPFSEQDRVTRLHREMLALGGLALAPGSHVEVVHVLPAGILVDQQLALVTAGDHDQAAVLAEAGAEVYSIEIVEPLADRAANALEGAGYETVRLRSGDGYDGWADEAPFDAIIVTAAAESIPPPLLSQLTDDGILIIPVGPPLGTQYLVRVTREEDRIRTRRLLPVRFVPFTRNDES